MHKIGCAMATPPEDHIGYQSSSRKTILNNSGSRG